MEVRLRLSPTFRRPHLHNVSVPISTGDTIRDVFKQVGLDVKSARHFVVSGLKVNADHQLSNGEEIVVLPHVGGG
jgi:molybdopterin converting factor small subunit